MISLPTTRDPNTVLTWADRINDLRHATGFVWLQFAKIFQMACRDLRRIAQHNSMSRTEPYKPYHPTLKTIRRIRFLEAMFAKELAQYRSDPDYYDRVQYRCGRRRVIDKFIPLEGIRRVVVHSFPTRRNRPLRSIDLTARPDDLAALGGLEAIRVDGPTLGEVKERWRIETLGWTKEQVQADRDRRYAKALRIRAREAREREARTRETLKAPMDDWSQYEGDYSVETRFADDERIRA